MRIVTYSVLISLLLAMCIVMWKLTDAIDIMENKLDFADRQILQKERIIEELLKRN